MVFQIIMHGVVLIAFAMIFWFLMDWISSGNTVTPATRMNRIVAMLGIIATCIGAEAARKGDAGHPSVGFFALVFAEPVWDSATPGGGLSARDRERCDALCAEMEQLIEDKDAIADTDNYKRPQDLLDAIRACGEDNTAYHVRAKYYEKQL